MLDRRRARALAPLEKQRPDVPSWLVRVVRRALEHEPSRRFPDGEALARALVEGPGTTARPRGRTVAIGLALVAVLTIAASTYALRGRERPSPPPPVTPPAPPDPKPTPSPSSRAVEAGLPEWYRKLDKAKKPPLPLPRGLMLGSESGEYVNEKDGSVLVYVPAGTFLMGMNPGIWTEPKHRVELSAYFLGKYEASNEQFEAFVRATGHVTGAEKRSGCVRVRPTDDTGDGTDAARSEGWEPRRAAEWHDPAGDGKGHDASHPVVQVAFADAEAYCKWRACGSRPRRSGSGPRADRRTATPCPGARSPSDGGA